MTQLPVPSDSTTSLVLHSPLPADQNPALVYLASLRSKHSQRNMRRYLAQIANGILTNIWHRPTRKDFDTSADYQSAKAHYDAAILHLHWADLRFQHVSVVAARLVELYAPSTVNTMLSALRGTLENAWKLNQMSAEDYHKAASVENVKHTTNPAGRDLANHEVLALLSTCNINAQNRSRKDTRDAAIIALLWMTGMRRSEAVGLTLADYDRDNGELKIVGGKGRKNRTVYIANTPRMLLERWLLVRGGHDGAIFERIRRGDTHMVGEGISAQAIYDLLKSRGQDAGLRDFSPHDLRRTTIGEMLDRGIDMSTVANIVGHSSTDTTKRYDRRGKRVLKDAAGKMDLNTL